MNGPGRPVELLRTVALQGGLVDGWSYEMIAERMAISPETVRFHIGHRDKNLHVLSEAEVIAQSLRGEI